jgi:hypothetical protein
MSITKNTIKRFIYVEPETGKPDVLTIDVSEPLSKGYYDALMLTNSIEEKDSLCSRIQQKQKEASLVCIDPFNFSNAVSAHESVAASLNEKIQEYEAVFGCQITPEDFNHIKDYDVNALKSSFAKVIEERLADIKSKSLKEMEAKAIKKDANDYWQTFAFNTFLMGSRSKYVRLHRIRLVNGKATFNEHDARALLEQEFSVDTSRPEYAVLIEKFELLRSSYNALCDHLVECRDVIKINPKKEALIREKGLIYVDFTTWELKLDLTQLGNRNWVG